MTLAACGSDDGGLSVDEYRQRANELCSQVNEKVEDLELPASPDELAGYLERLLALARPYDRRARELDPPEELEDLHRDSVRLSRRFERKFEEVIEQVRQAENPLTTFGRELEELLPDLRRADEISRELKLDECLENSLGDAPAPPS